MAESKETFQQSKLREALEGRDSSAFLSPKCRYNPNAPAIPQSEHFLVEGVKAMLADAKESTYAYDIGMAMALLETCNSVMNNIGRYSGSEIEELYAEYEFAVSLFTIATRMRLAERLANAEKMVKDIERAPSMHECIKAIGVLRFLARMVEKYDSFVRREKRMQTIEALAERLERAAKEAAAAEASQNA